MNHCKDCRWWGSSEGPEGEDWAYHYCGQPEADSDRIVDRRFFHSKPNGIAFNSEGHPAFTLLTGPEFGCVNFDAKEGGPK